MLYDYEKETLREWYVDWYYKQTKLNCLNIIKSLIWYILLAVYPSFWQGNQTQTSETQRSFLLMLYILHNTLMVSATHHPNVAEVSISGLHGPIRGHLLMLLLPHGGIPFPWSNRMTVMLRSTSLMARFMGPIWGPSGANRTQMGPMFAPWTLLSGIAKGS